MLMALAIPLGIVAGLLAGGRLERLGEIRFRLGWLAVLGFAVQIVLFGLPSTDLLVEVGPPIYVASTAAVLVALLANVRLTGLWLVAVGAASNLAAIVTNGGRMPVSPDALVAAGVPPPEGFSNTVVIDDPWLWPLTDILAVPPSLPFANVYSVGDILIGIGIVVAIAAAMRRGSAAAPGQPAPEAGRGDGSSG